MAQTPQPPPERGPYIVSPLYDWCWFLLPPVVCLGLGILISGSWLTDQPFVFDGGKMSLSGVFLGTLIHAHLAAVLLRSHANPSIFVQYRFRFVAVPLLLFVAILTSTWVAIATTVVATWWDVWHSGAQTFGFARIYDRNHSNSPELGRRLDYWLNQLIYAGPILAGVTLFDHLQPLESFDHVGAVFFSTIPVKMMGYAGYLTWAIVGGGGLFLCVYVFAYWRMHRQGYRVSFLKTYLLVSTALCSIYSWGFNTWGEAFFIMNLFHAVQYLGLVWATESTRITRMMRLGELAYGRAFCGILLGCALLGYGFAASITNPNEEVFWAVTMVISLMHFWYDGFIWSVRKKEI